MPSPIRFVFKDTNKNIWFTTISNGVYKALQSQTRSIFNNQKIRFEHFKFDKEEKNGISSSKITSYLQPNKNFIWFVILINCHWERLCLFVGDFEDS